MDPKGESDSKVEDGRSSSKEAPFDSLQKLETNNPAPASRTNLVELAVKFLTNPRVTDSPMDQKKAFLKNKGLNDAEIDQAIQLAGTQNDKQLGNMAGPLAQAPPIPARPLNPAVPRTTWREYALMTAVVGGVGYALYHFVRNYVIPWFNQPGAQEQRLSNIQSSVEQLHTNISETVASVNESTKSLRDLLSEQQQHLQLLSSQVTALQTSISQTGGGQSLREIKDEVGTLKGLLLNRHQFPPTPSRHNSLGSGGIPQWQRAHAQSTPTKSEQNGLTPHPTNESSSSNGSSPESSNSKSVTANRINEESSTTATKPLATEVECEEVRESAGGDGNGDEWKNGAD